MTNDHLHRRLAVLGGLALTAAVACWWLGGTLLALSRGADASRSAGDALLVLWLARGLVLALLGLRLGALHGWRAGAAASLLLAVPAWPLAVLAWSASTTALAAVARAELLLLAAAVALPLAGQALRRALRHADVADIVAAGAGAALAAALWLAHGHDGLPLH